MAPPIDVVVPVRRGMEAVPGCLERVLRHGDGLLGRLIVVSDARDEGDLDPALSRLRAGDPRVLLVPGGLEWEWNRGWASACNRGLSLRQGDVVLLRGTTLVTAGWLAGLATCAGAEERTASVSPVVLPAGDAPDQEAARAGQATAGLPPAVVTPSGDPACVYLRGPVLDVVGLLDEDLDLSGDGDGALADWAMRAQVLGFLSRRSHRAFVTGPAGPDNKGPALTPASKEPALLARRYPHHPFQAERFRSGLDGHLAGHALRVNASHRVRVGLDLRHLPLFPVGTSIYALRLARALSRHPEVDLTLVVRDPSQADGVSARMVREEARLTGVEVLHKPAQLWHLDDLELLFSSPAHLVITHQDLIAHRAPGVLDDPYVARRYTTLSYLGLQAAQRIITISGATQAEIAQEFSIPIEEIPVVHHGVDADLFARPRDRRALPAGVSGRYFLAVGTDYPHKDLEQLIQAHHLLGQEWRDGPPPALVLVGNDMGVPGSLFRRLKARPLPGVLYVGSVPEEALCALYQHTEALVYPSLYEGFGLPPLEAMAAGAPVIAHRISAIPEVCGEAALYPAAMTAAALCAAMKEVATAPGLRAELVRAGRQRVTLFTWERTAERTVQAYRHAILHPSPRALTARHFVRDALPAWARGSREVDQAPQPAGPASGPTPGDVLAGWLADQARRHPALSRAAGPPLEAARALLRGAIRARRLLRRS